LADIRSLPAVVLLLLGALLPASAQDPLQTANQKVKENTDGVLGFTFEERTRWEEKDGVNFGKSVDQQDMLSRLRIGVQLEPLSWLTISAMGQDARVPFYGLPAPNTMRDTLDLQEGYVAIRDRAKTGFGASFGRAMLNYGETRVIGSPQWSNVSRTFDHARLYYRTPKTRYEILLVSPVKVLTDSFNAPDLRERIWGTYDTFTSVWRGASIDAYALRHTQQTAALGTNSFGGRLYGAFPHRFKYSLEGIGQAGHLGTTPQRAYAWFAGMSRNLGSLNASAEYKVASGTRLGSANSGTYDQLAAANHDKFGHQDLFGWRNLKTFKTLETLTLTKALALNVMYTNHWLYSASDSLYSSQGAIIGTSPRGAAGTHVGQELDTFVTVAHHAHLFGAGFGHFFRGEFVQQTTPHINPRYFYVFQQYSFN